MAEIEALVLAAGRGERLGLGPKAWLVLGGRTLLERAVATMRLVADRVIVGAPEDDLERARRLCGPDVVAVPGGATIRDTLLAAFRAGDAPLILVDHVAHPFVTPGIAREVLAVGRARGAAVAVVAATSTVYHAPRGSPTVPLRAGEAWLMRQPFVLRRADLLRGLERGADDEGLSAILARVGVETALVPTPSWNIKVTTPDDWAMAQALERHLEPLP